MAKNVLFLCAHNQSRSVTAEGLLTGEKGYEVRSRALWRGTPRKVSVRDGKWADEVYVMMPGMIPVASEAGVPQKKIRSLWIPDTYVVCQKELIENIREQLKPHGIDVKKPLAKAQEDCYDVSERKMGYSPRRGILWTWSPPSEEEFVKHLHEVPPEQTRIEQFGYGYIPYYHIEEGLKAEKERFEATELTEEEKKAQEIREMDILKLLEEEAKRHTQEESLKALTPKERKRILAEKKKLERQERRMRKKKRREAEKAHREKLDEMWGEYDKFYPVSRGEEPQPSFEEKMSQFVEAEKYHLAKERMKAKEGLEKEELDRARRLFKSLERTTKSVRKLFE